MNDTGMFASPPQPLPEELWGDRWQFVSLTAEDLEFRLLERPIPVRDIMPLALPSQQHLPTATPIPGVLIEAGRQAMQLARWIAQHPPTQIKAINRELGALISNTADNEQWILVTYQDKTVRSAGQIFETRKAQSNGIHFLLIQPDDTDVTHTGLWLLR